jgi:polyhydroxyalkanoate synthesis regulator phasin
MPSKSSPFQGKKSAPESDFTPLYVVAGLTDALADALRGALAESQERRRKRIDELQSRGPVMRQQVRHSAEELRTFVTTLPEQIKHLPEATRARIGELQAQVNELLAEANEAYSELAVRGRHAVDDTLGKARNLSEQAEKLADEVRAEAGQRVDPLMERVQEGVTRARQGVSGRTATDTVTPRSAAKASATRRASAAKAADPSTAKKAAAKKAMVRKSRAKKVATSAAPPSSGGEGSETSPAGGGEALN